jgi:hypothetical protein
MMRLVSVTTATMLVAAIFPAPAVVEAQQRTIRCESSGNRQNFCRANTGGRATLVRELSRRRCTQWRTWGFERGGVWVRDGCRGDFRVGVSGGSGGGVVVRGGGSGAGTAAVVGAAVGAGVMAAILGNRSSGGNAPAPAPPPPAPSPQLRTPPSWLVGSFRGFDPRDNIELDITVTAQGDIAGTADAQKIGGAVTDGGIRIGVAEFTIAQEAWGFTATMRDSSNTLIYFRRLVDGQ